MDIAMRGSGGHLDAVLYRAGCDVDVNRTVLEAVGMSERGPKGDHGQHGDTGAKGAAGETGATGAEGLQGTTGERGRHGDTGQTGGPGPPGPRGRVGETGRLVRQAKWAFVLLTLCLVVLLTFMGCQIKRNGELAREGKEAHDALCIDYADLVRERDRTQKILTEQAGDPVIFFRTGNSAGLEIPRSEVERSVKEHNQDIEDLKSLECPPPAKE